MDIQQNIREIVLDTETTGLSCAKGDRIVEIGCVEMINHVRTDKTFQVYINPEREMSEGAARVTGYTDDFLKDKPVFAEVADDFLNFVGNGRLVIHNAQFDVGFLNSELERLGKPGFKLEDVVDTLEMARKKYPGAQANLDALCRRFNIDNSIRGKHGALVDSILLAEVYVNLLGGKQGEWAFEESAQETAAKMTDKRRYHKARSFPVTKEELQAHNEFLESLNNPMWKRDG